MHAIVKHNNTDLYPADADRHAILKPCAIKIKFRSVIYGKNLIIGTYSSVYEFSADYGPEGYIYRKSIHVHILRGTPDIHAQIVFSSRFISVFGTIRVYN